MKATIYFMNGIVYFFKIMILFAFQILIEYDNIAKNIRSKMKFLLYKTLSRLFK